MRIIPRRTELEKINVSGWKMIYGRRKTGKTFLARNFIDYRRYFFVNRNGSILDVDSRKVLTYEDFKDELLRELENGRIVVDEFHRLPEEFLDLLHAYSGNGELLLITSTLWLAMRLLGKRESPLLGTVLPVKVGLIDEREIVMELSKEVSGKELVEAATYLREPVLVPLYQPPLRQFLASYLQSSGAMIAELVGEAFSEEEVSLSEVYLAVLHSIADGKSKSGEIGNYLLSRGLIESPSSVQKYLKVLTAMGLIEKRPIHGKKKRFRYAIASPLLDLHFYLEAKYGYTEMDTPLEFIRRVIDEKLPRHIESFTESLLAKVYGLRPVSVELPELELDIALQGFRKLEIVGEVKWKVRVKREEIAKIEDKLGQFDCRKLLIVPDEAVLERKPEGIEVLTPSDLVELAEKSLGESTHL
ncbi:ATPase [Thermococcus profundus]|uniref:ATPase n=1 Tax=Thermococcus profundus TaxID=49899 RepID=A0A2Z2M9D7_THEPR|nr:AAA family ATPase [Thermococcus profundus]ASJ02937.1 ATPase [Thermococcus profundus]